MLATVTPDARTRPPFGYSQGVDRIETDRSVEARREPHSAYWWPPADSSDGGYSLYLSMISTPCRSAALQPLPPTGGCAVPDDL